MPKSTSIMKAATKKAKPAAKRVDRSITLDEMRRLMRVYGPTKSLRKRQSSSGNGIMKNDSMKRKFYRWFPDLDERFVRDGAGYYRPKFGHQFEMRYREGMRTNDKEILAKKRVRCRKQRLDGAEVEESARTNTQQAASSILTNATASTLSNITPSPAVSPPVLLQSVTSFTPMPPVSPRNVMSAPSLKDCIPASPVSPRGVSLSPPFLHDTVRVDGTHTKPEFEDERTAWASVVSDTEPLDSLFVAERGIFDEVEKTFYSPIVNDCPSIESSSCSSTSEEQSSSSSWENNSSSLDSMLDKSMEEYCAEILASDGDSSATEFDFGML